MVSLSEDEECRFFDAQDTIIGSLDSLPDPISETDEPSIHGVHNHDFQYRIWANAPISVHQRKNSFLRFMGLSSDAKILEQNTIDDDLLKKETHDRMMQISGTVLRIPLEEDSLSSAVSRIQDSNGSTNCKEEEVDGHNILTRLEVVSSPSVQKLVDRHIKVADTMAKTMNRVKGQFLCRLRSMACIVHKEGRSDGFGSQEVGSRHWPKVQRVKVRHSGKRLKELSAVFIGQDIQAHKGSILTMKFSLDGQYLASAGEDAVVRVWQVVEDERSNDIDIPDVDPSCLYFTVNNLSELAPLTVAKQKISMLKSLRKTKNSACIIFPPKVFRILEKPVHEFHGHKGEVLDLSWSRDNLLLSSSVDQTVRLWRVGSDHCVKVFPHSNYDEDYFVSGSIDGKVRTWSVSGCQVVDWIDVREIVTAVAYSPNGKVTFLFFFVAFALHKKKSPFKRIIGFQFCPQDPAKIMVTCGDSHVRILHGTNIIAKYRGQRNAGNPLSAAFTADGKRIVSASEDSNVYVWNCNDQKGPSVYQQKTVRSYECFSAGASVALPWSGLKVHKSTGDGRELEDGLLKPLPFSSPSYFSLDQEYFPESMPKVSATWPEEKLPSSSSSPGILSPLCKSRYKFFRSCQSSYSCHAWGLVIVTAGWDGRIRSFLNYGLPVTV
ncbi:G-protein beta WD-40 repeat-containing protein [Cynara cardunculus var. scolymus]|uniref:G-protein beta WD-40 repeat-containing protein n=1 Tax=Cynara cardunculus var. scolymus TaxID=59895 RepID=A0A103Y8R9_CYNCS|nr:G-protein beta WD-40 repeat-containing protein [Cynara cardunculus var. scolymus]